MGNLKGKGLEGVKFRRQHPVGTYILDFYCASAKVAVEVNGIGHDTEPQADHDARRTAWLNGQGIRVMRFNTRDIRDDFDGVLRAISGR